MKCSLKKNSLASSITASIRSRGLLTAEARRRLKHLRLLEDVFEGGDDKGILGREVMKLSASGQTGFLRDLGGPETRIAALADEILRRLQDPCPRFLAALGLGAAARHFDRMPRGSCRS